MPAFATIKTSSVTDRAADYGIVQRLNGSDSAFEYAEAQNIRYSGDIMIPSKALVTIRNVSGADEYNHVILEDNDLSPQSLPGWSRIKITSLAAGTLFIGNLMKRHELIGGECLAAEFWDDRWFLRGIPIRGALVYDWETKCVALAPRYACHMNPGGYRNCCRVEGIPGVPGGPFYVFTPLPEEDTKGSYNDSTVGSENAEAGEAIFWTPARAVSYWWLICQQALDPGAAYSGAWPVLDPGKVLWPYPSFAAASAEGTDAITDVNRKMPDVDFTGKNTLLALQMTLDVTGQYSFRCEYGDDDRTIFSLYPLTAEAAKAKKPLYLQRSGTASDIKTCFDGVVESDYSELSTAVLVEGAPPMIESDFIWSGDRNTSTLQPAWALPGEDPADEYYFMQIVTLAKDRSGKQITRTDGSNLQANSSESLQLARLAYPKVFRAFQLKDYSNTLLQNILMGAGGQLANYPTLKTVRPVLEAQLQPYYETQGAKRGRLRIPIRVRVSYNRSGTSSAYYDVVYNNGLRIDGDGLIWFDGLTDDIAGTGNIYVGSITQANTLNPQQALNDPAHYNYPLLRKIRINAAIIHDTRAASSKSVFTDADPNSIADELDSSLGPAQNGGLRLLHYVLNPGGFRQEHQQASQPVPDNTLQVTTVDADGTQTLQTLRVDSNLGISKVLYDDQAQIDAHCLRRLKDQAKVRRFHTWRLPGIRTEFNAGDFIDKVELIGTLSTCTEMKINRPIATLVYDFTAQETVVQLD